MPILDYVRLSIGYINARKVLFLGAKIHFQESNDGRGDRRSRNGFEGKRRIYISKSLRNIRLCSV